jgi:hypothetical protein
MWQCMDLLRVKGLPPVSFPTPVRLCNAHGHVLSSEFRDAIVNGTVAGLHTVAVKFKLHAQEVAMDDAKMSIKVREYLCTCCDFAVRINDMLHAYTTTYAIVDMVDCIAGGEVISAAVAAETQYTALTGSFAVLHDDEKAMALKVFNAATLTLLYKIACFCRLIVSECMTPGSVSTADMLGLPTLMCLETVVGNHVLENHELDTLQQSLYAFVYEWLLLRDQSVLLDVLSQQVKCSTPMRNVLMVYCSTHAVSAPTTLDPIHDKIRNWIAQNRSLY